MSRLMRDAVDGPWGDSAFHLSRAEIERGFDALSPPKDVGKLALIVARAERGRRETPDRVLLTPERGVPGDAWERKARHKIDAQVAVMRIDVARENATVGLSTLTRNFPRALALYDSVPVESATAVVSRMSSMDFSILRGVIPCSRL